MRIGAAALAAVLCVAGSAGCDTEPGSRRPPNFDATPPDLGPSTPVDASGDRMEASSSTLADGRVVTGQRPVFHYYSRDTYYVDFTTFQPVHTLTLIRADGVATVAGCSGRATPAELESFVAIATDLATVDALRQKAPCVIGDGGDDVTVSYADLGVLTHPAACDPQLQMLTTAASNLVRAVCARIDGGTSDASADLPRPEARGLRP